MMRSHLKNLPAALLGCLAFLLCLAGSASAAFERSSQNIASGDFFWAENYASENPPEPLENSRERLGYGWKTASGALEGPNVYTYVRQNPWSAFDPLGLNKKNLVDVAIATGKLLGRPIRNFKFSGKGGITTKKLVDSGSKVDPARVTRINKKYGDDFSVSYNEKGIPKFPQAAIKDTVKSPFGKNDTANAWKSYKKHLEEWNFPKKAEELYDSARKNYEMHHTDKDGVFELVDADVHKAFGHTGGNAWSKADAVMGSIVGAFIPNIQEKGIKEGLGPDIIENITPMPMVDLDISGPIDDMNAEIGDNLSRIMGVRPKPRKDDE